MQLQLNADLKIDKLEFNRAEQETYILKMQQVFDIEDNPGSRLLGLFKLEDLPPQVGAYQSLCICQEMAVAGGSVTQQTCQQEKAFSFGWCLHGPML